MALDKKIWRRGTNLAGALAAAAAGAVLLGGSGAVAQGVKTGLTVCGNVLIPSLFPFMVLACFVSLTKYGDILSIPLRPLTTKVFKLPRNLGAVVLMSLIGGYPVGAKMVSTLLEQERISRETAQRMMCFCTNSGPSFLIAAVGTGMFYSRTAGVILFATQTLATLIIGAAVSRGAKIPRVENPGYKPLGGSSGFVVAVANASSSMLVMCAYAILFSGVLSAVSQSGAASWLASRLPVEESLVTAVISGILEVTSGCVAAVKVGGSLSFALVSVFASFCGLSVIFQIMSCFRNAPIRFVPFLLARLAHCALSTAMAVPLYLKYCGETAAWISSDPPVMQIDEKTLLYTMCLFGMCTILILSVHGWTLRRRKEKGGKLHNLEKYGKI